MNSIQTGYRAGACAQRRCTARGEGSELTVFVRTRAIGTVARRQTGLHPARSNDGYAIRHRRGHRRRREPIDRIAHTELATAVVAPASRRASGLADATGVPAPSEYANERLRPRHFGGCGRACAISRSQRTMFVAAPAERATLRIAASNGTSVIIGNRNAGDAAQAPYARGCWAIDGIAGAEGTIDVASPAPDLAGCAAGTGAMTARRELNETIGSDDALRLRDATRASAQPRLAARIVAPTPHRAGCIQRAGMLEPGRDGLQVLQARDARRRAARVAVSRAQLSLVVAAPTPGTACGDFAHMILACRDGLCTGDAGQAKESKRNAKKIPPRK